MTWLWTLPLLSTLLAGAAMVRGVRLLAAEADALAHSARRMVPLCAAVREAAARARVYGSTVANAGRRYTGRHG